MAGYASINAGEWTGFLSAIQGKIKQPSELLKAAFMTAGFQDIIKHFEDESGPEGKWKRRNTATNDAYAKIKDGLWKAPRGASRAAYNPSNKVLQLTGNLRKSILPTNVKKVASNAIEIFANSVYGHRHDSGTDGMPKREFMWFSETAKDRMTQIIAGMAFGD